MALILQYGIKNSYQVSVDVADPNFTNIKFPVINADTSRKVLMGHFSYGVANSLHIRSPRYFTMLRDPAKRLYSHYNFVRRTRKHPLYKHVINNQLNFEQYIQSNISPELSNAMVRQLSGHFSAWEINPNFDLLYLLAKNNLDKMAAFGISEEYEKSLFLFADRLGWKRKIALIYANKTHMNDCGNLIEIDIQAITYETNKYDYMLYDYAKALFYANLSSLNKHTTTHPSQMYVNIIKKIHQLFNFIIAVQTSFSLYLSKYFRSH